MTITILLKACHFLVLFSLLRILNSVKRVVPYLRDQLSSFDLKQYGTVVLGCTHFPYFKNSLRKLFAEDVDIISGSIGTAKNLRRILEAKNQINEGTGNISFFKSGFKVEDKDTLSNYKKLLAMLDQYKNRVMISS